MVLKWNINLMYFYTGIVFFLLCMGNLKRNKMICFIKLISVTQEKKCWFSVCVESELKKALPLIQIFLERRFCFSFTVMKRIESWRGKCQASQKAVKFLTRKFFVHTFSRNVVPSVCDKSFLRKCYGIFISKMH